MRNEYFEMRFDDDKPAPLVCASPPAPPIVLGKTKLGRYPCATQGEWRLVDYRSAPYEGGRETFRLVNPFGWLVSDEMPGHVERALCVALGIEYIP